MRPIPHDNGIFYGNAAGFLRAKKPDLEAERNSAGVWGDVPRPAAGEGGVAVWRGHTAGNHCGRDVRTGQRLRHCQSAPPCAADRRQAFCALPQRHGLLPYHRSMPRSSEQTDQAHPGAAEKQSSMPSGGDPMHRGGCGPGFPDDVPGLGSAGRHHSGCRTVQPKRRGDGTRDDFLPG